MQNLSLIDMDEAKASNIATEMSSWCSPSGHPRQAPGFTEPQIRDVVTPSVIPVPLNLDDPEYHQLIPEHLLEVVKSKVYPMQLKRKRALPMPTFVPPRLTTQPSPRTTELMNAQPEILWMPGLEWSRMNPSLFSYLMVPEELLPTVEEINRMMNVQDVPFTCVSRSATDVIWKKYEEAISRMWGNRVDFSPAVVGTTSIGPLDKSSPGAVLLQIKPAAYYLVLALIEGLLSFKGAFFTLPDYQDYIRISILVAMFYRLLALGVGDRVDTHFWNGFPLPNGLWMAPDENRRPGQMYTI
jgi:hypothetical protein